MEVFLDSNINAILQVTESHLVKSIPYWPSEAYGFGKYIREYGYYPKWLPLMIFTEHSGPALRDKFTYGEINHDAPLIMFHSPSFVKKWKEEYGRKCYNLYSPFVFFRRKNKINISPDAKGTLAYPAHILPQLDDNFDAVEYIGKLKGLPEKYQPVSVSLHYHDLNVGRHKIFLENGIRVFTAGNPHDYLFIERFYSILRNFKYTTSNSVSTALFYSVEMGIPFFVYGDLPRYQKNVDNELAKEAFEFANLRDETINRYTEIFSEISDSISPQQKELIESALGLHDGVSRIKMCHILYTCYLKRQIRTIASKGKSYLISKMKLSKR